MVEPISMTVGTVIGLAGLYSVCLQAMEQVDDGKNFGQDSQKLISLFETEKFLFKRWGEKVGIWNGSKHHRCLDQTGTEYPVVRSILQNLEMIWNDADILSSKYGLELPDVTAPLGTKNAAASGQQKTSLRRKFVWVSKDKKKFERLLGDTGAFIEKLHNVVSLDDDSEHMSEVDDKLKNLKSNLEDDARERAQEMIEQQKFRSKITKYVEDQDREMLFGWINAISTENEYDEAVRERHQGTCNWIFSNQNFLHWLFPPHSIHEPSVLWIHGGPGMGKTFLSARVTGYMKMHFSRPTAFFFCTHEDSRKNQVLSIIRSWIVQLAKQRHQALEVIRKFKFETEDLVPTMLWDIFREILSKLGPCYLIIDGLDECLDYDPAARARREGAIALFLEELLRSTQSTGAKVLIISRHTNVINSGLQSVSTSHTVSKYAISMKDTEQDIQSFSRAITDSKVSSIDQRDFVYDQLSARCGGMFLWVRLAGERLRPGIRPERLKDLLTSIPPGLNHAYQRNLEKISEMEKYDRDRAKDILRWMLFAFRPLSVKELLHALEIDAENHALQVDNIPDINDDLVQSEILGPCGSLIETRIDPEFPHSVGNRTVHFVHFSAKEFLLNTQEQHKDSELAPLFFLEPESAHGILFKACLSYSFLDLEASKGALKSFRDYASGHWHQHFRKSGGEGKSNSINLEKKLFIQGPAFDSWTDRVYREDSDGYENPWTIQPNKEITPLHAACRYGLHDLCSELLSGYKKIPRNTLSVAAYNGQEDIVRLLLTREDVDVNANDSEVILTPLYIASYQGHHGVVQLLLENGATYSGVPSPLYIAAQGGYGDVVRLLVAREDMDVNPLSSNGITPLYTASQRGYSDVVRLLLTRKDVDVNLLSSGGVTPLFAASNWNHVNVVRLLTAREDLDVNFRMRAWGQPQEETALDVADLEDIKELLRQRGGKLCSELPAIETATPNPPFDSNSSPSIRSLPDTKDLASLPDPTPRDGEMGSGHKTTEIHIDRAPSPSESPSDSRFPSNTTPPSENNFAGDGEVVPPTDAHKRVVFSSRFRIALFLFSLTSIAYFLCFIKRWLLDMYERA